MNILFVSAVMPWPLHSGGQVRIYNLLKRLSKRHEITLVSFIRDDSERKFENNLTFCKHVHMVYRGRARQPKYLFRALTSTYPWLLSTYDNALMHQLLEDLLSREKYDLVHIEPFYVFPSLPKLSIPLVVGEHNVEYDIYEGYVRRFPVVPLRPLLSFDVLKLKLWEEKVWRQAAAIVAVSEADKNVFVKKTSAQVTVVPNGVDLVRFPFRPVRTKSNTLQLLFVGNFSWLPNVEGCKTLIHDIWPLLKNRMPGVSLKIIGKNIPKSMKQQADSLDVKIVGEVSDIAKEYQSADALIAPVQIGGGTKFKILEAMASGLSVITTLSGVQGLDVRPGVHYLEATTPEEFVTETIKMLGNTNLKSTVIKSARKCIEEKYGWDPIADTLNIVWQNTYAK